MHLSFLTVCNRLMVWSTQRSLRKHKSWQYEDGTQLNGQLHQQQGLTWSEASQLAMGNALAPSNMTIHLAWFFYSKETYTTICLKIGNFCFPIDKNYRIYLPLVKDFSLSWAILQPLNWKISLSRAIWQKLVQLFTSSRGIMPFTGYPTKICATIYL